MTEFHEVFLAAHPEAGIILFLYLREFLNSFFFHRDQENSHIFKYSSAFQGTKNHRPYLSSMEKRIQDKQQQKT